MSTKFIAVVLAALLTAAGVMSFSGNRGSSEKKTTQAGVVPVANSSALASEAQPNTDAYLNDFKAGYADGFNTGVSGANYPDEASMTSNANGYVDGFSQGFTDGQGQQVALRGKLCRTGELASYSGGSSGVRGSSYASSSRRSSAVLGERASYDDYRYADREVDRGIGSTARKALLIAGGAAAGAGLGGALGGRKGALIGALAGGGTGTVLALRKSPSRAFNRRVSKKSVLTKTLIGAGAGAAIGALAGGKRGALAGVALGGGGGAIWSLMTGKRRSR